MTTPPISPCVAHKHRDEVPIEKHHLWPLGMGGPDEEWNIIRICPNGHTDVHDYMRLIIKYEPKKVPWLLRRMFGFKVRLIAEQGYRAAVQGGWTRG